eukprot:m.99450 g.99450  ORF g.99450 m.99450 type:complete len:54 (-) comp27161_c0_seq3:126-287(-)
MIRKNTPKEACSSTNMHPRNLHFTNSSRLHTCTVHTSPTQINIVLRMCPHNSR